MCQVDEDFRDQLERVAVPSVSKKCVKCKETTASVAIRAGDTYCRGCFKEYFVHKFRAMLGKNRIIFPGEKVLLAVSGGPSSCSMLRQVEEGLSKNAHNKLRFLPGIVYIDEGGALGQSIEERQRTVAELHTVFKATCLPFHIVPLEQVLDLPSSVLATGPPALERPASTYKAAVGHFIQSDSSNCLSTAEQKETSLPEVEGSRTQLLQQLIGSASTLTAKEDLLNTLRHHLLVHTARTEGYSKVMLGDSCTRLAVKLLTSVSLGRGAQLAQDTGFSDSRYGDIILVRPMRDYSAKEIAFYNHMFKVPSVFVPSLETKTPEKASIQRLTEGFITKLQADFPSTVSIIYRTGEKLQTACKSSSTTDHCDRCLLCMCALDTAVDDASAFNMTLISEQLSQIKSSGNTNTEIQRQNPAQVKPELNPPSGQCCSSSSGGGEDCGRAASGVGCCSSAKVKETPILKSLLCYSCRLTVKDMSSLDHLPLYILSDAQRRQRRSQMREEIGEFLLDDGDDGD
ncbi:cytoplasmic tRNA 2-thiolation protein 2 [Cheilinus undulatus]|uniref:cytoplasmic tRNA 2-thiolation protein 2 n=1 Tax=Cheilinus undulatus TaxID=241271 RepID=UPI001BD4A0E1|nr:cytoplasmic tRNA 2-thiolation protein 2 [Cheilinus undulatus]XP_041644834.1 cytoplasmic tRNA 2-thiolation protein 2 [Cheilinus undulatus]